MTLAAMTLAAIDYIIIVCYLSGIAGVGMWMSRGPKTAAGYFIADRTIPSWAVGFTLMATIIGSGTFVAHPAAVFKKGMFLLPGLLIYPIVLVLVAVYIAPFYRRVVKMSAYEYIGARFGFGGRLYSSFGFLADRSFDMGITLLTTGIAINVMCGWNLRLVILGVGVFTMIYTMIGGIRAVVWTDFVQGLVLFGGALMILVLVLTSPGAGSPGEIIGAAWEAGKFSLGSFEFSWDSLFDHETTTVWLYVAAMSLGTARRYATDQHVVQRFLIARSDREARNGALFGAFMCLPVWIIFLFIGACLYGYYQTSAEAPPEIADQVMPYFLIHHLPSGLTGLLLAAIMAAAMSSVSSDLNSFSTVVTMDYFTQFFKNTSDRAQLRVGRLMVAAGGILASVVALLLVPDESSSPVMERTVVFASILSGGMFGLFCLGFFTRRATRTGCYVGIGACLLYTAWGVMTQKSMRECVDLGPFNFEMNPILIGIGGHLVLFIVGYLASLVLGGYRPDNIDQLVVLGQKKHGVTTTS